MDLYLVRHAIAEDHDPQRWPDDSERPLSKRGLRRFRQAAQGLTALVPEVDVVLSSPYVRAWHTASILHEAGWPAPIACRELTVDDPAQLVSALEVHSHSRSLALVGHEPYLTKFAAALLQSERAPWIELKKGGVVRFAEESLTLDSAATLVSMLPPKVLRAIG